MQTEIDVRVRHSPTVASYRQRFRHLAYVHERACGLWIRHSVRWRPELVRAVVVHRGGSEVEVGELAAESLRLGVAVDASCLEWTECGRWRLIWAVMGGELAVTDGVGM